MLLTKYCRLFAIAMLLIALTGISGYASADNSQMAVDPITAIDNDYRQGNISLDEKAVLQLTSIRRPESLPAEYRTVDSDEGTPAYRGATAAIVEVLRAWEEYSDETRTTLSALLVRPGGSLTYVSPTGYFRLHYDVTGPDAVPAEDLDFSGTPDYIEKAALYMDTTLDKHIGLGYMLPPSDGTLGSDSLFDVYFEEMDYYGYAVPEGAGPADWDDYYSYLVLHRDYIGFPSNDDPEGNVAGAAKATCAHEFHHCVQFGYNAFADIWIMEYDATWFEDIAFDAVNDNYNYLPSYMDYPEKSLMESSLHMYGSFIWGMYLSEKFDTTLMVSFWEGARYDDAFQAMSDSLAANHGWAIDSAFVEFTQWNYMTGLRYVGDGYEEAYYYHPVSLATGYSTYPQLPKLAPDPPAGYAACYVPFLPGMESGNVRISFDGDDNRSWAAYIIKVTNLTNYEFEQITLDPVNFSGSIDVYGFDTYYSVILVGVNLDEYSSPGNFTTAASIFSGSAVTSSLITDTAVYSGAPRLFEYEVHNPASQGDVYRIIAWDDSGWINFGFSDKFIAAGESYIQEIPVTPPVGTPLGNSSTLHFKATSLNDTSVSHQVDGKAVAVLQHGDANFDGPVDIGDLTYLISYLFLQGPDPVPVVASGEFDCVGMIDIADITRMIQYLFTSGDPSPCNPF